MNRLPPIAGLALLLAACAPPVEVADGDTIIVGTRHYRLWGIEAPDLHQTCAEAWPAGAESRRTLEQLIARRRIVCEDRGLDRYRRTLALCRADGLDLGAAMVGAGMAWASAGYARGASADATSAYLGVEVEAREQERGVHAFACRPQRPMGADRL
jgi:endonuclease YncB( thermonuclease family)